MYTWIQEFKRILEWIRTNSKEYKKTLSEFKRCKKFIRIQVKSENVKLIRKNSKEFNRLPSQIT